jgi:Zn-dependent peptidase ImmA (M78 family)
MNFRTTCKIGNYQTTRIKQMFQDIGISKNFFRYELKSIGNKNKIDKWNYIKLKSFCVAKKIINRKMKQPMEWEKIFPTYMSHKLVTGTVSNSKNSKAR